MSIFSLNLFIGWTIVNVFLLAVGIWLYRSYKKSNSHPVRDLAIYAIGSGFGFIVMSLGYYFMSATPWMKVVIVSGGAIKSFVLLFILSLVLHFFDAGNVYKKIVYRFVLLVMVVFFAFKFYIVISSLAGGGQLPAVLMKIMGYFSYFTLYSVDLIIAISGIWFIAKSLSSGEAMMRIRGIIIGSGLLLIVSNYAFCGAGGLVIPFYANWYMIGFTALFIFGIFFPIKDKKPEEVLDREKANLG